MHQGVSRQQLPIQILRQSRLPQRESRSIRLLVQRCMPVWPLQVLATRKPSLEGESHNFLQGIPARRLAMKPTTKSAIKRATAASSRARGAAGIPVIVREAIRHRRCLIWDGKSKCQAMRCKAPKAVATIGKAIEKNMASVSPDSLYPERGLESSRWGEIWATSTLRKVYR